MKCVNCAIQCGILRDYENLKRFISQEASQKILEILKEDVKSCEWYEEEK